MNMDSQYIYEYEYSMSNGDSCIKHLQILEYFIHWNSLKFMGSSTDKSIFPI
jgi:hypothetical protein